MYCPHCGTQNESNTLHCIKCGNVLQHVPPQAQQQVGLLQQLPNSTAVLVLGILSIVGCTCYGIIGIILGIIALVLAGKSKILYETNPGMYSVASFNNLKAGRICAIIGVIISALYIIFFIIYLIVLGTMYRPGLFN